MGTQIITQPQTFKNASTVMGAAAGDAAIAGLTVYGGISASGTVYGSIPLSGLQSSGASNGQALVYSVSANAWQPGSVVSGGSSGSSAAPPVVTRYTFANNTTSAFAVSGYTNTIASNYQVFLDGVCQVAVTDYSLSATSTGGNIVLTSPAASGVVANVFAYQATTAATSGTFVSSEGGASSGLVNSMNFANGLSANVVGNTATIQLPEATTGQVLTYNGSTWAAAAAGGATASFRNRIINGNMAIDQRNGGAAQTFTAAAALAYSVDRFYGYCTGANVTGQRVAVGSAGTSRYRYRFTGAASNTGVRFGTRLEFTNTTDLANSTATLQVKASSTSITSLTWTAYYANTDEAFGTIASPTRTQIATGTFTITSTEATYSAQMSVPAAATTGIEIVFSCGALLAAQTLTLGDIQFEAGSTATSFEFRQYGTELALCQRYYEVGSLYNLFSGMVTSGEIYYNPIRFCVNKRVAPFAPSGSTTLTYVVNSKFPATAPSVNVGATDGFYAQHTANLTGTGYYQYSWTANAEL